jgi:hypothetical protein
MKDCKFEIVVNLRLLWNLLVYLVLPFVTAIEITFWLVKCCYGSFET